MQVKELIALEYKPCFVWNLHSCYRLSYKQLIPPGLVVDLLAIIAGLRSSMQVYIWER